MRWSQILMIAFIALVIFVGLFGPYLISLGLAATAGLVYATRRRSRNDNSGAL